MRDRAMATAVTLYVARWIVNYRRLCYRYPGRQDKEEIVSDVIRFSWRWK